MILSFQTFNKSVQTLDPKLTCKDAVEVHIRFLNKVCFSSVDPLLTILTKSLFFSRFSSDHRFLDFIIKILHELVRKLKIEWFLV